MKYSLTHSHSGDGGMAPKKRRKLEAGAPFSTDPYKGASRRSRSSSNCSESQMHAVVKTCLTCPSLDNCCKCSIPCKPLEVCDRPDCDVDIVCCDSPCADDCLDLDCSQLDCHLAICPDPCTDNCYETGFDKALESCTEDCFSACSPVCPDVCLESCTNRCSSDLLDMPPKTRAAVPGYAGNDVVNEGGYFVCRMPAVNHTYGMPQRCGHISISQSDAAGHLSTAHAQFAVQTEVPIKGLKFVCQWEDCDAKLSTKSHYVRHLRSVHAEEKRFGCNKCPHTCATNQQLQNHMKMIHDKSMIFECSTCHKSFTAKQSLDTHMNLHLDMKPYACHICGVTFTDKSNATKHKKDVHGELAVKCPDPQCFFNHTVQTKLFNHAVETAHIYHLGRLTGKKAFAAYFAEHKPVHNKERRRVRRPASVQSSSASTASLAGTGHTTPSVRQLPLPPSPMMTMDNTAYGPAFLPDSNNGSPSMRPPLSMGPSMPTRSSIPMHHSLLLQPSHSMHPPFTMAQMFATDHFHTTHHPMTMNHSMTMDHSFAEKNPMYSDTSLAMGNPLYTDNALAMHNPFALSDPSPEDLLASPLFAASA